MKQLFCMVLAALMLLALFTGCGKTETPMGQEETEATLAKGTEWTAVPQTEPVYEVPDRFTGKWTGIDDTFNVTADAEIVLPEDMGKLCTAKVKRHTFTMEEVNKTMDAVLKGNPLYQTVYLTKEKCQARIDDFEACLRGEKEYTGDGTLERLPEVIAYYREEMKKAPHEGELILADQFQDKGNYQEINGYGEVDGKKIYCWVMNSTGKAFDWMMLWEGGYGSQNGVETAYDGSNTNRNMQPVPIEGHEKAVEVGDAFLEKLGMDGFTCDAIFPVEYLATGETGVTLEYVRNINGLPLTKTNAHGGATEEGMSDYGYWEYERVQVYVLGEDRVIFFWWHSPYEVTDIQPCGKLMDFDEIRDIFERMFFVKNDYWKGINASNGTPTYHDIQIDKVQLTLARIRPKDNVGEGTIVPVWDFWGTETTRMTWEGEEHRDEPCYQVLLTINALDGTLIDREIGY